ncbi:hypothetical protein HHI36_014746 [Cryptolaemus montrouzieri]|uniref:Uncharacterized protein n=1 Tax=Cryptolaemus montrouzieri TaxID=559131 RepID=A0ABD2N429_9CUCU
MYLELSREIAALKISGVKVTGKVRTTETVRTDKKEATSLVGVLRGADFDILEKLSKADLGNYTLSVGQVQSGFGDLHFEHVYVAQLNNRNVRERLTVNEFLNCFRNQEMKQALILNRLHTVSDALVKALEFKAAKQLVKGVNTSSARVRQVGEEGWVDRLEEIVRKLTGKKELLC